MPMIRFSVLTYLAYFLRKMFITVTVGKLFGAPTMVLEYTHFDH